MRTIAVITQNPLKFNEIADMAQLYGCHAVAVPNTQAVLLLSTPPDAILLEQTTLQEQPNNRVLHISTLQATLTPNKNSLTDSEHPSDTQPHTTTYTAQTIGHLSSNPIDASAHPDAYNWDLHFIPLGSTKTLHELKQLGLKVSARQLAIGSFLQQWLHYPQPVAWNHMQPTSSLHIWLSQQPLLNTPNTSSTHNLIQKVANSGAWLKPSPNRRTKHYWWPGLNAGIPMTPKKDYIHELTFLVHDIIHWTMPDVLPSSTSFRDHRLYVITRMLSEAITLVMADMVFINQLLQDEVPYDFTKRKIHPLYNSNHPPRTWCLAMAHYAIRGDDSYLSQLTTNPNALTHFKEKYAPFFEMDLLWTHHNSKHISSNINPSWTQLFQSFASSIPNLQLTTTSDYHSCWSDNDETLVNQVFSKLWTIHWDQPASTPIRDTSPVPSHHAQTLQLQRWWLGQLALTYAMDDLPLSQCVRDTITHACLRLPTPEKLQHLIPLWENYIDALEALSRLSPNDATIYKQYYPVLPPLYVSYDKQKPAYIGIPAMWTKTRNPTT